MFALLGLRLRIPERGGARRAQTQQLRRNAV